MNFRLTRRHALLVLAVALLATSIPAAALARSVDTIVATGRTYSSNDICTTQGGQISHGSRNTGRIDLSIEVDQAFLGAGFIPGLSCAWPFSRPAGYIALLGWYYYWGWGSTSWTICASTDWRYNSRDASYWTYAAEWYPAPCGSAFYWLATYGYAWNGQWLGGGIGMPNYHYFDVYGN